MYLIELHIAYVNVINQINQNASHLCNSLLNNNILMMHKNNQTTFLAVK